ncbi:MAG: hypothetical protein GY797_38925 [Deltaproteobacteria bacterium]|nr:hypothetical protein [Deltaproteobacteria bacterium]
MDEKLLLKFIASSAYATYVNTLSGRNSPAQQFYFERARNPEIGDLVLEVSSFSQYLKKSESLINHIGHLVSIKSEPYPDFEVEELGEDESVPERDIWTIETLDNRFFRWENCDFIVIPATPHDHQMKIDNEHRGSRARQ